MIPQLQFLNEVIDVPVVQVVQLPLWWSKLLFSDKMYMPVVAGLVPVARQCRKLWFAAVAVLRSSLISLSWSRGDSHGLPARKTMATPQLQYFSGGRCPCCAGRVPCPCWAFSTTGSWTR